MTYYKIIQNDQVIGVGFNFVKWDKRFLYCDIDEAQYVQDILTEKFYCTTWLREHDIAAPQVGKATVIVIDSTEYDELYEQLKEGDEVPFVPPISPEPEPEPTPEPVPVETPMTIQQMRDKIMEQGQMIDMLTECLLEVSEVIYEE